jgi:hypothetical protein
LADVYYIKREVLTPFNKMASIKRNVLYVNSATQEITVFVPDDLKHIKCWDPERNPNVFHLISTLWDHRKIRVKDGEPIYISFVTRRNSKDARQAENMKKAVLKWIDELLLFFKEKEIERTWEHCFRYCVSKVTGWEFDYPKYFEQTEEEKEKEEEYFKELAEEFAAEEEAEEPFSYEPLFDRYADRNPNEYTGLVPGTPFSKLDDKSKVAAANKKKALAARSTGMKRSLEEASLARGQSKIKGFVKIPKKE